MTQKFYLRNITAVNPPTAGEKSTVLPEFTLQADNATSTEETRSLLAIKGTSQISIAQTTDAVTAARNGYHARFTSPPLVAGTYGSGTWTIAVAINESNAASNFLIAASIYFWRPSNSTVVGFVYDSNTTIGTEPPTAETGEVNNISGSGVTIQNGDVLVFEFWRKNTQNNATARTNTLFFDGTTDPTDGTGTTDAASYLNAPADIPLLPNSKTFTIDSTLKKTLSKTLTTDSILLKTLSKTFSSDTILKKINQIKTFTIDSTLAITATKNFLIDSILLKTLSKTFFIDSILKQTLSKTFVLDAFLKSTFSKTLSIDSILKKGLSKSFLIDGILKQTLSKAFSTDSILLKTLSKVFSVDSILTKSLSKTFTIDSELENEVGANSKTFTVDTMLKKTQSKVLTIDALLKKGFTKTFSIDGILLKTLSKTFSSDSILRKTLSKTVSVDSITVNPRQKTFSLDSTLKKTLSKSFLIDVILEYTIPPETISALAIGFIRSVNSFSIKRTTRSMTFNKTVISIADSNSQ